MVNENTIQILDVFFVLEAGKMSFYRGKNKPDHAQPIVAERMDCDGWSHAWFFDISDLSKQGWHLQFDGTTFDQNLSDAVMNCIKFPDDTTITTENSGSHVDFVAIAFTQYPFGELGYDFNQLPEDVRFAYKGLVILERLKELGWTTCTRETAIASKSFQTAVGEKVVHAYLSKGDNFNRTLHGTYQSEGRNILEPHAVLIPNNADLKSCVSLAEEFASGVDDVVSNSYAVNRSAASHKM